MRAATPRKDPSWTPRPRIQIASSLKPGDRLEWIKHLNKHPEHVVKIVAIRSGAFVLTVVAGMLIWAFRG